MTPRAALATALCFCALAAIPAAALAAAPTIPLTTLSGTTTTSTTLEADVNPQGKATKYHFEYGSADCSANPCTSTPEAQVAAGTTAVRVSAPIEGLSPGTTYHFRAVARHTNEENGETASPDRIFTTYLPPQIFDPCPNDHLRKENPAAERIEYSSANLPDCRAYEQATPVSKGGGDVTGMVPYERASVDGGRITYLSVSGVPGASGAQDVGIYLAARGADDWSNQGLLPPASFGQLANVIGWTPDFSHVYTKATLLGQPTTSTFLDTPLTTGTPATIASYAPSLDPKFAAASTGGAQVLFESEYAIPSVPGALQGKRNLYLWDRAGAQLTLVGVLNDEQAPANGTLAGPYDWMNGTKTAALSGGGAQPNSYYTQDDHTLSTDASAAFFTAAGSGQLYARLNPMSAQSALTEKGECTQPELACTIHLNATQKKNGKGAGGADPAGTAPAAFMGASADGTKALFTSSEMLTDDANTGPEQEPPAVVSSDLEGTPASIDHTFVPAHALSIAVDSEHVYWVDPQSGAIGRANLDGTEIDDQFITATEDPKGLAVSGGYIYWTNGACEPGKCIPEKKGVDGTLGKARLNGNLPASEVDQAFIEEAGNPWAVVANAEHVYWTQTVLANDGQALIGRAKSDGTEVVKELVEAPLNGGTLPGIALDSSHIYWTETIPTGSSWISRANLDGTDYRGGFIYVADGNVDTSRHVRALAVRGNYIYWAAQGTSEIGRASLSKLQSSDYFPTSEELEFIQGAGHPYALASDASHLYWSANGEASPNPGNDLYSYDAKAKPGEALTDLAPDSTDPNGSEVRGVVGTSADYSYVYFAANGVPDELTSSTNGHGENAEPGNCPTVTSSSEVGVCNLYLAHGGTVEFIARLQVGPSSPDVANWAVPGLRAGQVFQRIARVTPDGRTLLFVSERQLTGYSTEGTSELYRFRVGESAPTCVSCDPSGEVPGGFPSSFFGQIAPSTLIPSPPLSTLTHNLSSDGNRIFFETTDSLVAADTNGDQGCALTGAALQAFPACTDVYEWEAQGTGSCDAAHVIAAGGCLYLISTGKGIEPALIADASSDGSDLFFFTRSRLVGQDQDTLLDVYDARLGGGLDTQNPSLPPDCENEGCKEAVPSVPQPASPTSDHFAGSPDPVPHRPRCHKPKVRRDGKCAKKHKRGSHKRRVVHDRRGSGR